MEQAEDRDIKGTTITSLIQTQVDLITLLLDIDFSVNPELKENALVVINKSFRVLHRLQSHIMDDYPPIKGEKELK